MVSEHIAIRSAALSLSESPGGPPLQSVRTSPLEWLTSNWSPFLSPRSLLPAPHLQATVLSTHSGGLPWLPTLPPHLHLPCSNLTLWIPQILASYFSFLPSLFYGLHSGCRSYHLILPNIINTSLLLPSQGALQDGIPNSSNVWLRALLF